VLPIMHAKGVKVMDLKIKQILLKNFATVNELKIDFKDQVTYLVGENGSGKTTCGLNAIWFILEGIAKTGKKVLHADRFRFIGKYGKSAVGQITLHDEKENIDIFLQRKMTKGATTLSVAASDGRDLGPDFVDKIFNIFSINPEGFAQLTPKEQATVLGIDTAEIDARKKVVYNQRRELGYDVKQALSILHDYGEMTKADSVDVQELLNRKVAIDKKNEVALNSAREHREELYQKAIAHNKEQNSIQRRRDICEYNIKVMENKVAQLNDEIAITATKIKVQESSLEELPVVAAPMETDIPMPEVEKTDTSDIVEAITRAQEQNKEAAVWTAYTVANKRHAEAVVLHDQKDCEYQALEKDRIEYLKSCNLPFSNITINEKGELEVDGRSFNKTYFSKGEILRAGIKMAAATNPELKYIFVPDAQSIDEVNREKLFAELVEAGFQVVAEMVGTEKKAGDSCILLRESRVVDSYEDQKSVL